MLFDDYLKLDSCVFFQLFFYESFRNVSQQLQSKPSSFEGSLLSRGPDFIVSN